MLRKVLLTSRDLNSAVIISTLVALLFLGYGNLLVEAEAKSSPKLARTLQSSDDRVFVYDNVYSRKALSMISNLAARFAPFDFIYPEKLEGMKSNDNGNLHWVANFSPEEFAKSRIWRSLVKRLPTVFNERTYVPYEAQSILINRGDFPSVQKGTVPVF